jgi:hypothetical protein
MSLLEMMFGCPHKRFSFPQTRRIGGRRAGIYVVCLKCGTEFEYDFEQMKIKGIIYLTP